MNKMFKNVLTLTLLVFVSPVFAEEAGLNVGISIPLSGPLQEYGVAVRNAFNMAIEENGPGSYQLFYEDNQYEGKHAVSTFNKLVDSNKVDLIYLWGEICLYSIAPLTDTKKVLVLSMSVDKRPADKHPYIVRTINPSEEFIDKTYSHLRRDIPNFKKLDLIMTEDPYFEDLLESLKSQKKDGEEVRVISKVNPEQMDFKTELLKLRLLKADALAVYLLPGQVSSFYRTAKNLKVTIPTIGTDIFESSTEVADSKGAMNGAKYHNIDMPEEFGERYLAKFGNDIQVSYAYNAYTTAKLILSEMDKLIEAKKSGENIKDTFVSVLSEKKDLPFEVKKDAEYGYYFSYPLVIKEVTESGFKKIK